MSPPELFPTLPAVYADIVFDRPLDHAYTYLVPEPLHEAIAVGKRVECPFGQGNRPTPGYVVRLGDTPPSRAAKSVTRVLDAEALFDEHLLKLTRWMADYYLCGWGQVLHAVVPAGAREKAGTKRTTFVEAVAGSNAGPALPDESMLSSKQMATLEYLRTEARPVKLSTVTRAMKCGPSVIQGLIAKGLARKFSERIETSQGTESQIQLDSESEMPLAPPLELSTDQRAAWERLEPALIRGYRAFLLHGVTGSGKTEIYLKAIEDVIRRGQEAIVLVPEISLTPQTIDRFRGRCGNVAVLHSHLSDAERGQYWRRIAAGQVQVVVGARSAVFAPTRKLGLLVIDEEHETSFKQDATPRYHARDTAVMRAYLANVPIILGSATPSLESWHNAHRPDGYTLLSLPKRVENRPMPEVRTIDLRHEKKAPGKFFAIGPTLENAMRIALKAGGQVMLLLNRRGFSTHIHCADCGHVATCAHCDLAMTFHRGKAALVCHYCGFEAAPYQNCPVCSKPAVRYQGLGTEKLQDEIASRFPDKVVQRMDSDTMVKPGSHQRILDKFRDGHIDILLGTQMIAKGLDFPNVTLVGVVNADVGLHLPDFRAAERTFQLLSQVAGRTGRGDKGGHVLIQTFTPDHPCIALATKHGYETFAAQELVHRKQHNYPPYHRMARLIVRSEKEDAAAEFAAKLAGAFNAALQRPIKNRHCLSAAPRPRGVPGLPLEGLLPLAFPGAVREQRCLAHGATRSADGSEGARRRGVSGGCGPV